MTINMFKLIFVCGMLLATYKADLTTTIVHRNPFTHFKINVRLRCNIYRVMTHRTSKVIVVHVANYFAIIS